jgi:hypothetical protein
MVNAALTSTRACVVSNRAYVACAPNGGPMKLSETFRENATNCAQLAENATTRPTIARYRRMELT